MSGWSRRIPGAGRFTPHRYETLAIPFQSKTWRDAHRIHHGAPSLPFLPPGRLDALSPEVRALAAQHGVRYAEYRSVWSSLADSLSHLQRLARRSPPE